MRVRLSHIVGAISSLSAWGVFATTVTIDPKPRQTLTSFGVSGAWWPNDLIHFPESTQKQLGHFLFSEDGLHLSSYRYNMGGDGGDDRRSVTKKGHRVESFLLRNGTYDWSRDQAGMTFLKMAQQYDVPYITYFINAAPSNISTNGAACGWHMKDYKVQAFAEYIKTVLSYWTEQGIKINYISPMNEPDDDREGCGQEGMVVARHLRPSVFEALRSALDDSPAKGVDIIGDETSRIMSEADHEYHSWLSLAAPNLSHIAVHNYDFPTDDDLAAYHRKVKDLTRDRPLSVKFTETCCATTAGSGRGVYGEQYDPTMGNALIVARYVWQFLTIVQAESFDWWSAVTNLPCSPTIHGKQCTEEINSAGWNSGLVYIDGEYNKTHDYNLYFTKRAFMLKHFAYFHRPGSVRYDIPQDHLPSGVNAFASRSPSPSDDSPDTAAPWTWSVLFMNNRVGPVNITIQLPNKRSSLTRVVQTTDEADWEEVTPLPTTKGGKVSFELPAQSLYTLQFTENCMRLKSLAKCLGAQRCVLCYSSRPCWSPCN